MNRIIETLRICRIIAVTWMAELAAIARVIPIRIRREMAMAKLKRLRGGPRARWIRR